MVSYCSDFVLADWLDVGVDLSFLTIVHPKLELDKGAYSSGDNFCWGEGSLSLKSVTSLAFQKRKLTTYRDH